MKKFFIIFCAMFLLATRCAIPAAADTGPKPSVEIQFKGLENQTYFVTLLSEDNDTGPRHAYLPDDENADFYDAIYQPGDENYDVFLKFAAYQDSNNFYFLQEFSDCSETQAFSWVYMPPNPFKVLLYFPEQDCYLEYDSILSRTDFHAVMELEVYNLHFHTDGTATADFTLREIHDTSSELLYFFSRVLITLAIEIAVALMFLLFERKQLLVIAVTNLFTQMALNAVLFLTNWSSYFDFWLMFILLEVGVLAIETLLYMIVLPKVSKKKPRRWKYIVYPLVANAASCFAGILLEQVFPALFY